MKPSRRGFAARIATLEAHRMGRWEFVLEDGTTIAVPLLAVLEVLGVGATIVYGDGSEDGEEAKPPEPTRYLALLGRAVSSPDNSLLAQSVVAIAREAREKQESAG